MNSVIIFMCYGDQGGMRIEKAGVLVAGWMVGQGKEHWRCTGELIKKEKKKKKVYVVPECTRHIDKSTTGEVQRGADTALT